jgi:hypothetical protein
LFDANFTFFFFLNFFFFGEIGDAAGVATEAPVTGAPAAEARTAAFLARRFLFP